MTSAQRERIVRVLPYPKGTDETFKKEKVRAKNVLLCLFLHLAKS
jgi:hypothetical protein